MSEQANTQTAPEAITQHTVTQTRVRCRHIHAAGNQCGSPALRNEIFCYYHHTTRRPKAGAGGFRYLNATEPFQLPIIEDRASALAVASEIMSRIASNDLDVTRAGRLIYNLQVLAAFLPRTPKPAPAAVAHPVPSPAPGPESTPPAPETPDLVTDVVDDETHGLIAPPASSGNDDPAPLPHAEAPESLSPHPPTAEPEYPAPDPILTAPGSDTPPFSPTPLTANPASLPAASTEASPCSTTTSPQTASSTTTLPCPSLSSTASDCLIL